MAHGFRHGSSGKLRRVPVLNEEYPKDVSVEAAGSEVSFTVQIAENGKPAEYAYQWYYDGNAVNGATAMNYTRAAEIGSHKVHCVVTNEAGIVYSREATVTAEIQYVYNAGVFDPIAGDVTKRGAKSTYSADKAEGKATVTKNANDITIIAKSLSGTQVYFTKKIDLTAYNTLFFSGSGYKSSSYNYGFFMGVWSSLGSAYNSGLAASNSAITGPCSIDVSNLSGEYYIGFFICDSSDAGKITVNSVYLK